MILITVFFTACGGGGSSSTATGGKNETVYASAQSILKEIETDATEKEKEAFSEFDDYVTAYNFTAKRSAVSREYNNTYRLEPSDPAELYDMISTIALLSGHAKGALWASLKAVSEKPNNAATLAQAGVLLNEVGRYDTALPFLKSSADIASDDTTMISLATTYKGLGEMDKAQQALQEALSNNPDSKIAQNALHDFYLHDQNTIASERAEIFHIFSGDLKTAFNLKTTADAENFGLKMGNDGLKISNERNNLMNVFGAEKYYAVAYQKIAGYGDRFDTYNTKQGEIDQNLTDELDAIDRDLQKMSDQLSQEMSTCAINNPHNLCPCMMDYVSSLGGYYKTKLYKRYKEAAVQYMLASLANTNTFENDILARIYMAHDNLNNDELLFAYRYMYKTLAINFKSIAANVSIVTMTIHLNDDQLTMQYNLARSSCKEIQKNIDELHRLERELEEEQKREALEAMQKTLSHIDDVMMEDALLDSFEACFDSVGCLGVEGTRVSVTVGGLAFAKFSYDYEKVDFGVRVGLGISDPTGNIAGASVSLGGHVGKDSSSINIKTSESAAAGTMSSEQNLISLSSDH